MEKDILHTLRRCVVGKTKGIFDSDWLQENFHRLGWFFFTVKKLAGGYFLVEFDDEKKMEIARKDEWVCFDQWLSEVKPWSEDFKVQSRFAWIYCHGLLIQAWNLSSFKIIANLWGEFVQVDGKTLHCSEFIRGAILKIGRAHV